MELQFDDKGNVVVQDGKPVYVAEDGKTVAFDYPATLATISRLNGEAKSHRERAEAAEEKIKLFDGIEDPAKAREAMETLKNIDSKKLIDAGKVDEVRAESKKAFDEQLRAIEEKYKPVIAERENLKASLVNEIVGGNFSRSKFIAEKLAIPVDIAQARFGSAFHVEENNRIVARDANGNSLFSRARPGEIADFDEALELIVDAYPYRDSIMKGSGASGGGAGGGIVNGKKTVTRAQFETMAPADQAKAAKELTIVD
jgi:hypothetical protein